MPRYPLRGRPGRPASYRRPARRWVPPLDYYGRFMLGVSGVQRYWRLGDDDAVMRDSASGVHGSYLNAPTLGVAGLAANSDGRAASFNGTDESGVGSYTQTNATDPFSIVLWLDDGGSAAEDVLVHIAGVCYLQRLVTTGGSAGVRVNVVGNLDDHSSALSTSGEFIVVTYDGVDTRLYRDGLLAAGPSDIGDPASTGARTVRVGALDFAGTPVAQWDGTMDELAIANTALSLSTIQAIYMAGGGTFRLSPASIVVTRVMGTPKLNPGLAPGSIEHARGIGTPGVNPGLGPASIVHTRGMGAPVVSPGLAPASIVHGRAMGDPSVELETLLSPASIEHARGMGAPVVSPGLGPGSIVHTRGQGSPAVSPALGPASIVHTRGIGAPAVSNTTSLAPDAIVHARAMGAPELDVALGGSAIVHSRAMGQPALAVSVGVPSIVHARELGSPSIPGGPPLPRDAQLLLGVGGVG